jgi:hypothetical protein
LEYFTSARTADGVRRSWNDSIRFDRRNGIATHDRGDAAFWLTDGREVILLATPEP